MLARAMFAFVDFAARKGLVAENEAEPETVKQRARAPAFAAKHMRTGICVATDTCSSRATIARPA